MARRRYRRRIASAMKLGLSLGYAPPGTNPADLFPLVEEAERLGFDSVWVSEAWGTDAVSVLGWLAARTERIKLGSAIMQIPRSEEHTSELQSLRHLVCRLLLEKKKD